MESHDTPGVSDCAEVGKYGGRLVSRQAVATVKGFTRLEPQRIGQHKPSILIKLRENVIKMDNALNDDDTSMGYDMRGVRAV